MKYLPFLCAVGLFCLAAAAFAQVDTTYVHEGLRVYEMLPLSVTAQRTSLGKTEATMSRDFVRDALEKAGIEFVRRGLGGNRVEDAIARGVVRCVIAPRYQPAMAW